jgi:hypothetical protein
MGVTEFILHGNDEVINALKPNYKDLYNINFIPITSEEFFNYRKRDRDMHYRLKELDQLSKYNQQSPGHNICPLWIIQNDLKKQYLTKDELCFILDLDEFVDITASELKTIKESNVDLCRGVLNDRVGYYEGQLVSLNKNTHIFEQLDEEVNITHKVAHRATNKVIITKGHLEHCFGHHGLYKKVMPMHLKWPDILNVNHCKYFKQNIEGGLGPHGRKEQVYFNNKQGAKKVFSIEPSSKNYKYTNLNIQHYNAQNLKLNISTQSCEDSFLECDRGNTGKTDYDK